MLASELQPDLYRIGFIAAGQRYIGETEKNLRRVFDAVEECGAVLLDAVDAFESAARSKTAMIATLTSKSAISCSAWRPIAVSPS